jgi:hypothetical protein
MSKKSQEESEQPAKVYQLDAIESQVKSLTNQVTTGFTRVNTSIDTLLVKSESQVTPQQLNDNILAAKSAVENKIEEEVEKIHLEYRPIKENNKWLIRAIAAQAIILVGQLIFILYVTGTPK